MSTDAICTCSHGLGVLRHADDCPVAVERRQPVPLAALSAPSEPVRPEPRVWGLPVIPEDVKAVRDDCGEVWRRSEASGRVWLRTTDDFAELTTPLVTNFGPLTEVVEP